ncbi:MAG: helix-turn-helix transcriptional regulator [Chlorobiaceae bacterium]|nr:helix-turn-helix transcriptional regulator [Chlorobiaceae bacterium]
MKTDLEQFGIALQRFRKEQGLSQEKLAELTDLHRTYISDLERAQRNPTLTTLSKIAKALSISISTLVKDVGNE